MSVTESPSQPRIALPDIVPVSSLPTGVDGAAKELMYKSFADLSQGAAHVMRFKQPDGSATYTVRSKDDETGIEYGLLDYDEQDVFRGVGSVFSARDIVGRPKEPYVTNIWTPEDMRGDGLGTKRYIVMNGLSELMFGQPLHSDYLGHTSPSAKGVWERLVRAGQTERFEDNGVQRYRFLHR